MVNLYKLLNVLEQGMPRSNLINGKPKASGIQSPNTKRNQMKSR